MICGFHLLIMPSKDSCRPDTHDPHTDIEWRVCHLAKWQTEEQRRLRDTCYAKRILFATIPAGKRDYRENAINLLRDIQVKHESQNRQDAVKKLDEIVQQNYKNTETIFVLDADRTLAPVPSRRSSAFAPPSAR